MLSQKVSKIKTYFKKATDEPLIDSNNQEVKPGSRIIKGYWGEYIVFGSKVPGNTWRYKIRMTNSGSKVRLINPLMTPDNIWEGKRTSVSIDWGDGVKKKIYKQRINSGRFNRDMETTKLEHTYTSTDGDVFWITITGVEPLVPYGCDIISIMGTWPADRYDLNTNADGEYCGLFGVNQFIESYPELNKLYEAGEHVRDVSSTLLDNWKDTRNMNWMFKDWNALIEVPENFFKKNILKSCELYIGTFWNCDSLTKVPKLLLGETNDVVTDTNSMFNGCPKLTNHLELANASKLLYANDMYGGCKKLVSSASSKFLSNAPALITTKMMFYECSILSAFNWNSFCINSALLEDVEGTFGSTAITHAGMDLKGKVKLRSVKGLYYNTFKLLTIKADMFDTDTSSTLQTTGPQNTKLTLRGMFRDAGDRTVGMIVPTNIFYPLSHKQRDGWCCLSSEQMAIFQGAYFKADENKEVVITKLFVDVFSSTDTLVDEEEFTREVEEEILPTELKNIEAPSRMVEGVVYPIKFWFSKQINQKDYRFDVSWMFDGIKTPGSEYNAVISDTWIGCDKISTFNYVYANSKWDHFGSIFGKDTMWCVESIKGLFAGATINFKVHEKFFCDVESEKMMICRDYSEMFKGAKYKWSETEPIDYVVHTSATEIDMSEMFAESNIRTYRPIHWRTPNERTSVNMTDFSTNAFSAPKDWILDGYSDSSKWQPRVVPQPFILWVNIDSKHRSVSFAGNTSVSVDWGDETSGGANSALNHTYTTDGNYAIKIVSNKAHQPTTATMNRVFRLDGELPYDATIDLSQKEIIAEANNKTGDRFIVNYVGPRVVAVAKSVKLTCHGYLHPELFKYGSNSGYREGLKYLNIVDPMEGDIKFNADFVIVNKTIGMDVEFESIPFKIRDTTHVELDIGMVRMDNDKLHVEFVNTLPHSIPLRFWHNAIGHKFNKFDDIHLFDIGYLRPEHFDYRFGRIHHPDYDDYVSGLNVENGLNNIEINDLEYGHGTETFKATFGFGRSRNPGELYSHPKLINPDHIDGYHSSSNVVKWHPALRGDRMVAADLGNKLARVYSARGYNDPNIITQGNYDDHYTDMQEDWITFILENVDDDISIYNLHDDNPDYAGRELGTIDVEVCDADVAEDAEFPKLTFDNKLGSLGHITAKLVAIKIKARFPVWLSSNARSKISAVYGIITNCEGDFILNNKFAVGNNALAPNIRNVGESVLWALQNDDFTDMFRNTKLEVIPSELLAYSKGNTYSYMFANTPIKKIPDYLVRDNGQYTVNTLMCVGMFADCSKVDYVFEPICSSIKQTTGVNEMFKGVSTYAYAGTKTLTHKEFHHYVHVGHPERYADIVPAKKTLAGIPNIDKDHFVAINRSSSPTNYYVSCNSTLGIDPTNAVDKWNYLDYLTFVVINKTRFDGTTATNNHYSYTQAQYDNVFKYLHNLRGWQIEGGALGHLVQSGSNVVPRHDMLFNNENLIYLSGALGNTLFDYTPNIFFINQLKLRYATALLCGASINCIAEDYPVPPTHLADKLGRPIYIGGASTGFHYIPRNLDKMLWIRHDFVSLSSFMHNVTCPRGEIVCPTFKKHRVINVQYAFYNTNDVVVTDDTFIDIDRESNVYIYYEKDIRLNRMFQHNGKVSTDCRIFHIWNAVRNDKSGYEFANTTALLHPPKDMFDELLYLTKLNSTFRNSNIRDLPHCNPIVREYPYFAAESKLSTIPQHWFTFNGSETLDIRYAFNNCTGLIITHKLISPTVTAPVVKYASLENAWSIIGDDDVIFAGVNTKLDGTDRSLIKIIPEEALFRQTIDVHDPRWTLSVKGLELDVLGNRPVEGEDLFMVSWGDGSDPSVVSYREIEWEDYSHIYESSGRYQVMILSTQWCCYVDSPQDMSSKYTTYSIDGMFQNTTVAKINEFGLINMFGYTVEKIFDTMFDRLSDVATVRELPGLFEDFGKMKLIPEKIFQKMVALTNLTSFLENSGVTRLPAGLFSKNINLVLLDRALANCKDLADDGVPETLFSANAKLQSLSNFFIGTDRKSLPRKLLQPAVALTNIDNFLLNNYNFVLDNTYDDFLSKNTKLQTMGQAFGNVIIKQLPPNFINRCTALSNLWSAFALWDYENDSEGNQASKVPTDDEWNDYYIPRNKLDGDFTLPANWFPPNITSIRWIFGHRFHLKGYEAGIFDHCTKLANFSVAFLNSGIKKLHSDTLKYQTAANIDCSWMFYKDKRLGKAQYIHYIPKIISSTINGTIGTKNMLQGSYGVWTEAELFSGIKTNPAPPQSLYKQEFEFATYKLKMTGDGTFITLKPITKNDVTFSDFTIVDWGDGVEDIYEKAFKGSQANTIFKHNYKKPGEYTIKVGAQYCLVPIIDTMPEAYQITKVDIPSNVDTVKQVTIPGIYAIGHVEIDKDSIYKGKQTAEIDLSVVPYPYKVGDTYEAHVTIGEVGLKVGETTKLELTWERDTSDPFQRLEIGGELGIMEGYTEFPRIAKVQELQYAKWIGKENFLRRNTQITSILRSFMNLNYEFRIADKVFHALINLTNASCAFWNTKMVIEPGWAPDFNKCVKLSSVSSIFRGGNASDVGNNYPEGDPFVPAGTPVNKITWKVNQNQYQPFSSLTSLTNIANMCLRSDITYVMRTGLANIREMGSAYEKSKLTWLPADYFRTLSTTGNVNAQYIFRDTPLTAITAASDGKSLFEFTIGANRTLNFHHAFIGSQLNAAAIIDMMNKSAFIKTTATGTNINLTAMFSWMSTTRSFNASALKLAIPSRTGTLNLSHIFSNDEAAAETDNDRNRTGFYNIKPGAITIAASGSPNVIVNNMFDHCYADITADDAHDCFVVTGDDANFTKAKALADASALNTLTVMTTTVVPK